MADPTAPPTSPAPPKIDLTTIPSAVNASLAQVPPDRSGALVMGLEWKYGLPFMKFGTALRVGENVKLAGDAETRFSKMSTSARGYLLWTW